jgi:serine phosphatase RsbU (regulator of sigma subunit)/pSer/pThr/pTyr-binding forkhead associated (FHA) protein
MPEIRLDVMDALGRRVVTIERTPFTIGRRSGNDLRLAGSDVSRDHAEIALEGGQYLVRDRASRYGTFVNDEQITEKTLKHGDVVRLGRGGGAEMVFLTEESAGPSLEKATTSAVGDLRQIATLLDGLRALGSGRVLDDVLALVMDSAIEVTGAERGFLMLANASGELEFKLGRARGRVTMPGKTFGTSRKIPEEVFATGEMKVVADLMDGDLANVHMGTVALGIRHVLCTPLVLVRYVDKAEQDAGEKRIGVLYLDSREKGQLLSRPARQALETLAVEAAVAIENARLYREAAEKVKLEQELRIAAEIQRALLPQARHSGEYYEAVGSTIPCRAIGGDFFDYIDLPAGEFGFALGDVAGKGAPAALLTAVLQGVFSAQALVGPGPAATLAQINRALIRRAIESRFATMLYGVIARDGRLTYCNAGHNPPFLMGRNGVKRLETGDMILGLFDHATYEEETVQLEPGDTVVVFSDGVSEAQSATGDEFGEDRLLECLQVTKGGAPTQIIDKIVASVREFAKGTTQSDDVTVLVVRYVG